MSERRHAFRATYSRSPSRHSLSPELSRRDERLTSWSRGWTVRYTRREDRHYDEPPRTTRRTSQERGRSYSQSRVRARAVSSSRHPSWGSEQSEGTIRLRYVSPSPYRTSHASAAAELRLRTPRRYSHRGSSASRARQVRPATATRPPYPPDTSPSSSDSNVWEAREFSRLTSSEASESERSGSLEAELPSNILEKQLLPHVRRLAGTKWLEDVSEYSLSKQDFLAVDPSDLSDPVDRDWEEMSQLFYRGSISENVDLSYLCGVSDWCGRRVTNIRNLIASCTDPEQQAEAYELEGLEACSRQLLSDVVHLRRTIEALADYQQSFLLNQEFTDHKICNMAKAREKAMKRLLSCERTVSQIQQLAVRSHGKLEEELRRARERLQRRLSERARLRADSNATREDWRGPDTRSSSVRPRRSREFILPFRAHPRH